MINNYIPEDLLCIKCNEQLEEIDKGEFHNIMWHIYKCPKCGEIYSDEPDYDIMTGGIDDY